jgi:hypothetical protein
MEWKWTKGETYERSRRVMIFLKNNETNNENQYIDNTLNLNKTLESNKTLEDLALSCSLNHDENTWEILNQSFYGFRQENKRADTDKRLAEREMITQVNMNPYLTNNNYVNDIETHNNFMKPQSTTLNKVNLNESNE